MFLIILIQLIHYIKGDSFSIAGENLSFSVYSSGNLLVSGSLGSGFSTFTVASTFNYNSLVDIDIISNDPDKLYGFMVTVKYTQYSHTTNIFSPDTYLEPITSYGNWFCGFLPANELNPNDFSSYTNSNIDSSAKWIWDYNNNSSTRCSFLIPKKRLISIVVACDYTVQDLMIINSNNQLIYKTGPSRR